MPRSSVLRSCIHPLMNTDDARTGKDERMDSGGIGIWENTGEMYIMDRCVVLHDERLVEGVLGGVEWVEAGLGEKCGQLRRQRCGLDCRSSQLCRIPFRSFGLSVQGQWHRGDPPAFLRLYSTLGTRTHKPSDSLLFLYHLTLTGLTHWAWPSIGG